MNELGCVSGNNGRKSGPDFGVFWNLDWPDQ